VREVVPTRSEALALSEERMLLRDGHHFLDEKRMLLAGEILRQLAHYERLVGEQELARKAALTALGEAIERHGIDELQARAAPPALTRRTTTSWSYLGVRLLRLADPAPTSRPESSAGDDVSFEVCAARVAFARLARISCEAGLLGVNLMRLAHEYRRTERRANALENVLIPELDAILKHLLEQLDGMDQEEAVRVRLLSSAIR
jgi:V/A-type H+-transporting ATPase subunit D